MANYGDARYGDGQYGGGVYAILGVGGIGSQETFGEPDIRPLRHNVLVVGVASAEAFGRPALTGGVPPMAEVGGPAETGIRDDELYTCWPRDDAVFALITSESDPLYAILVSND